jgi:serine/threonine-protein kinase RsbW
VTEQPVVRRLSAPVAVASLDAVGDLLAEWWEAVGDIPPRIRFGFETAVIEIAGNIVEHSAPEGERGEFTVELRASPDRLRATFGDDGRPTSFDPDAVRMAPINEEAGRGLALAIAGVDHVDYRRDGARNVWELESERP